MEQKVAFYSDGVKIGAMLFEPEDVPERSCPGIVMCQGMIGIKEYFRYPLMARRFASLGYVTIIWDYRGVGESEGEYGCLYPLEQAEDIRNALTYLELHPKVDPRRLALYGMSFGGGMVPYVAGVDPRVICSVSIVGWGDGKRWLRSLRRHSEWLELLQRIEKDRHARVLTGKSELLGPGEILNRDPVADAAQAEIYKQIPGMENFQGTLYSLATAEKILEFQPVEVVDRISPRTILYIVAEKDAVTPADDVVDMYYRTREPKRLQIIPGIPHHGVYEEPLASQLLEATIDWFKEHLRLK